MGRVGPRTLRDRHRRDALSGLSLRDDGLRVRDEILSLGLLVYLLSFLILPALHLSNHALDHVHADGGGDTDLAAAPYGATSLPRPDANHRTGAPAPASGHGHGRGTAAHFAVTFAATQTFVFTPVVRPMAEAPLPELAAGPARGIARGCAKPRGPPRAG